VSKEKKIAVLLTPKTGTFTLCSLFHKRGLDVCGHNHENYNRFEAICKSDISYGPAEDYTVYAFYRDPLDRALSMLRYIKRWRTHNLFHAIYGNDVKISSLEENKYEDLSPELKALNDAVPLIEVFRKMHFHRDFIYRKQVHWIGHPRVHLLDYSNYEKEVRMLSKLFEIDITDVPVLNASIRRNELDTLTPEERQEIVQYYALDYEFLESKGIIGHTYLI